MIYKIVIVIRLAARQHQHILLYSSFTDEAIEAYTSVKNCSGNGNGRTFFLPTNVCMVDVSSKSLTSV